VTFHQPNHREEYFPVVARTEARAFFGLSPKAVRLSPPVANNPETITSCSTFDLPARPALSVSSLSGRDGAINDDHRSLYDASDSAHAEGMDTPSYLPPASVSSPAGSTLFCDVRYQQQKIIAISAIIIRELRCVLTSRIIYVGTKYISLTRSLEFVVYS
jgi:hypothetical protein